MSVSVFQKADQLAPGGGPNVKAGPVDRVVSLTPAGDVTLGLNVQIAGFLADAVCQRQRHAGVVGPLPTCQAVGTPAPVAGHRLERARGAGLDCRPQGIAHGQINLAAMLAIKRHIRFSFPAAAI